MHLKIALLDSQDLANTGQFIVISKVHSHKATDLKSSEEIIYHFNRRFPFPQGPVTACVNLKYSTDMSLEFACLGEYFDWDEFDILKLTRQPGGQSKMVWYYPGLNI